jgi:hypothetical protein
LGKKQNKTKNENLQQQRVALAKEDGFDEEANVVEFLESQKEELSNKELMQLHEGLGLVLKDPEAEISVMKLHPYGI